MGQIVRNLVSSSTVLYLLFSLVRPLQCRGVIVQDEAWMLPNRLHSILVDCRTRYKRGNM
jgi:hypothetical protein